MAAVSLKLRLHLGRSRKCNVTTNSPKTSGHRTAAKRWPRRRLLLVSSLCSVVSPHVAQSWTWTCRLDAFRVEDVPLTALQKIQKVDDGRRRLRSSLPGGDDAAALPRDEEVAEEASGETAARVEGRRCACGVGWYQDKEPYYCPLPADSCWVQRTKYGVLTGVKCYVHGGWGVGFARKIWLFLFFILLLLALYLCFSSPGRNAVRYVLSKCFPGMNGWIAEHLLRAEIEARNLLSEEFERFARRNRRTEGWISEYRVKTKLYSREGTKAEEDGTNVVIDDKDADLGGRTLEAKEGNGAQGENANDLEDEEGICTICLTDVEDGDRVPDLDCGHLFHADCLSEWILKKNSCPLCSGPVARGVRSFETDLPAEDTDNARSEDMVSRLRCHLRDVVLDVATGRDRRAHARNRNRLRAMLNDGSTDALGGPRRGTHGSE